ncbi:hypothetical protein AVEN_103752-1 [Araneus ventricosus]|uniref:HTH CENPB-type domain-containing protein n=1 Tax=Araneus ventricosus TaxID=182803 RepID=A0A4Y2UPS5_ARAVE|nr:hypothetical protein AVEN_103752-1 [Araneus ventricosus]
MQYGPTYTCARQMAYSYAKHLKRPYPPSWEMEKSAGIDWIKCFMKRHKSSSLRKPENTSINTSLGFNKANIEEFKTNLENLLHRFEFTPEKIYNLDKTGITNVLQAPKVIALSGEKQVRQTVSSIGSPRPGQLPVAPKLERKGEKKNGLIDMRAPAETTKKLPFILAPPLQFFLKNVFAEDDFLADIVTDQKAEEDIPSISGHFTETKAQEEAVDDDLNNSVISTCPMPESIRPSPKVQVSNLKKRKFEKGKSRILTDTPEKDRIAKATNETVEKNKEKHERALRRKKRPTPEKHEVWKNPIFMQVRF